MFDYGARMYMPDLGRWGVVDPMAESFPDITPYRYGFNNPVVFSDPTGMLEKNALDEMISKGGFWTNTGDSFNNGRHYVSYTGEYSFADKFIDIPEVSVTAGKENAGTWNDRLNNGIDSFVMYSKFTGALMQSTLNQNRTLLYSTIENTKVGQSVSAAESFLFLELPASFAGGELLAAGWRAAGLSRYICGPLGKVTNNLVKICFTEGTLVATEKGHKKIEDIKEDDLVWSYNEETGKKELKKVVALSRNTSSSLVKISVNGTEITCTPEHPFYVNGSWIEAKDLTKGSFLPL